VSRQPRAKLATSIFQEIIMRRLFNSFFSLPRVVRLAIPVVVLLLVLAVIVGLIASPVSTPATVSTVRPAASPAAVSTAASSAVQVPAVTAAAPPAPQTGVGGTTAAIMRPALPPQTLRDCAREVLGLAAGSAPTTLANATFTASAEREDCKSPFASLASKLPEDFASYDPGRGYLQITRTGIFKTDRAGEHVFVLASPNSDTPRRCAFYVGDLSAPVVEADKWSGQFAIPAVAALEVGLHEVAVVCSFETFNATRDAASVTASVRAPGDTSPRLVKLGLPDAAAPVVAAPAAVPEPAK
jgi:hypothetical protein